MKKNKIDIKFLMKLLAFLFMGIGIGLIIYPSLVDWMPFFSGLILIIGIVLILFSKK